MILPGSKLDVVAYGCTSASMAIGEEKVFGHIRSVRPDAQWHEEHGVGRAHQRPDGVHVEVVVVVVRDDHGVDPAQPDEGHGHGVQPARAQVLAR